MGALHYRGRIDGGDVDDPAASALLADLDDVWEDLPTEVRQRIDAFRNALTQDHEAWQRRHDEAAEVDQMREDMETTKRNAAEQGFDVDDFSSEVIITTAALAQRVARLAPWERREYDRLLAEETGDAWTHLPKIGDPRG